MKKILIFAAVLNAALLGAHLVRDAWAGTGPGITFEQVAARYDANADGSLDVADPVLLLEYLFLGGRTPQVLAQAPDLSDQVAELAAQVADLTARLEPIEAVAHRIPSRDENQALNAMSFFDVAGAPTLTLKGVNLRILGDKDGNAVPGRGNLILGTKDVPPPDATGALVIRGEDKSEVLSYLSMVDSVINEAGDTVPNLLLAGVNLKILGDVDGNSVPALGNILLGAGDPLNQESHSLIVEGYTALAPEKLQAELVLSATNLLISLSNKEPGCSLNSLIRGPGVFSSSFPPWPELVIRGGTLTDHALLFETTTSGDLVFDVYSDGVEGGDMRLELDGVDLGKLPTHGVVLHSTERFDRWVVTDAPPGEHALSVSAFTHCSTQHIGAKIDILSLVVSLLK